MRISEALRQLRTTGNRLSADQIVDIDFLTEYPVIDDPELKKPMLYYCPIGQWLHISGTITKSYRRALETIDVLDENLGTCRQQIKMFDNAYFNPEPVGLFEDQRRVRIPLVNFFRYYGYWLLIAEQSSTKKFTPATVRDDFRILVDSSFDQYKILLEYCCTKLVAASETGDQAQVFSNLEILQKMVTTPIVVFEKSSRDEMATLLMESARIESEIEHRIANELPSAVAALLKAIEDFPNVDPRELPSTYDWIDVSRIETVHPEIVTKYVRVSRAFKSLSGLILDKQSGNWLVSSDKNFDAAFNANLARDVVAHISMAEANATEDSDTGFLFPLNMTGWEPDALLPELRKFVTELPFRDSVSHQIALVHLFLPFYVANLQSDRRDLVRTEFVKAAQVLKSCLAASPMRSADELRSLVVRCETAWQDWDIPIGIAYSFLDNAGKELLLGSTHDAVRLLTTHCGDRREKMHDYVVRSRLQQVYADSAMMLKAVACNDFAREHYERYGFIPTELTTRPLFEMTNDENTTIVQFSQVDDEWKHGSKEYVVGKSISKSWNDDHMREYDELNQDKKRFDSALAVVRREAREMWKEIENLQGIDLTDRIKKLGLSRDVKGVLIARWIQIGLEAREIDLNHRMDVLGWTVDKRTNWTDPSKRWNAYYNYFSGCGFMINKNGVILPKSFLWPEERVWYLEHRVNK